MSQLRKHFGQSLSTRLPDNDAIVPIGGTHLLHDTLDIHVQSDFSKLSSFFDTAQTIRSGIKIEPLRLWLADTKIDIVPDVFAAMWSFQKALEKDFPDISKNRANRSALYNAGTPLLSDVIHAGCAECSEIALMAQHWLQLQGIQGDFFVGAVAWDKTHEFSDPHAFLILSQAQGGIIYDPANPIQTSSGLMPSAGNASAAQFEEWNSRKDNRQTFMLIRREILGQEVLYGVSNGSNINPNKEIIGYVPVAAPRGSAAKIITKSQP